MDVEKLVISSTLLCRGIAHVGLELLAMDCSLIMMKGCYQHISHLLSYVSPSPSTTGHSHTHTGAHIHTHTHRWLPPLPTNFTGDLFPEDVSWCDWLPRTQVSTLPQAFFLNPHISAITAQHAYNHVLASHPYISFVEWFVSSVPLNGMCLFSAFSANLDVNATLKKIQQQQNNMFSNCRGWGFGVSTTLIRDVESEILPEDHPDTPLHLNIQQCVMLTEKQLTQKCPVLSAMCVTHLACEKAACLLYFIFCFISTRFLFPSEIYFCISIWL